jgi:hypothetical protein
MEAAIQAVEDLESLSREYLHGRISARTASPQLAAALRDAAAALETSQ